MITRGELCLVFCFCSSVLLSFVMFVVVLFSFCFGTLLDWKVKMVCHLKFARLEIKIVMLLEL